jgi:hypothetical protein
VAPHTPARPVGHGTPGIPCSIHAHSRERDCSWEPTMRVARRYEPIGTQRQCHPVRTHSDSEQQRLVWHTCRTSCHRKSWCEYSTIP